MKILGLSGMAHDAAAAVIVDGEVVSAVEEERVTRIKNTWTFPKNSVKEALRIANINANQLDIICFYWNDQSALWPAILYELKNSLNKRIPTLRRIASRLRAAFFQNQIKKMIIAEICDHQKNCSIPTIFFVDHHSSHIAHSFYSSNFESCAGLVIDGRGEYAAITGFDCSQQNLRKLYQINMPHSLGYIYGAVTQHLGFRPISDEYRIMGLAPYGKPDEKLQVFFDSLIQSKHPFHIGVNLQYCNYQYNEKLDAPWFNNEVINSLGSSRISDEEITDHHANIAFALQKKLEHSILTLVSGIKNITKNENLVLGGGVAMNSVCNNIVFEQSNFKNIFVPPAPSDQGCAIGSALYIYYKYNHATTRPNIQSPYLGPSYSNEQIKDTLDNYKLLYSEYPSLDLIAEKIAEGKICGFFQGQMEFGPRALGNRSILADPRIKSMRDKINQAVKFREEFRPFAATILYDKMNDFTTKPVDSPYMSFVSKVKLDKQALIPAVVHIDGTCRFQTLKPSENPLYYQLIESFFKLTGIPLILNTSFNVKGEPIVMSPSDAIRCFFSTGLDCLVIGKFLVEKTAI
ncbi:MAG TPA: carbamoyltransferase C-terminal domain-containing protein [Patescibacteria group bacterium]|nr:carbamoyltransferase C-terminal domain-containing protein [Gammaproteobacteria bacterium]HWA51489.1 carbamoyltransferase C-terminal domain-containing protein [Patescibacteria group bacterium]